MNNSDIHAYVRATARMLALPLDEMLERTIAAMRRVSPWETP